MKTFISFVVVLALAVIGFFVYKGNTSTPEETPPTFTAMESPTTSPTTSPVPSISASPDVRVQTFNVSGANFKFNPAEIKVKKGDRVKIVFTSKDMMHDWVVDEFDARTKIIPSGQTDTIEFVADKAGTFEYYCSVGQHRANGMVGKLIVE